MRMTRFWNKLHQYAQNRKIGKPNNFKKKLSNKTKGPKQNNHIQLRSHMHEGGEP